MYKHILVPTDGSPLSLKAAREAVRLASPLKAKITALHVIAPFETSMPGEAAAGMPRLAQICEEMGRAKAKKALSKVAAAAGNTKCETAAVVFDTPWRAIVETAKAKKCDLIVMASHGRKGLAGLLIGSETQKVLTHSKIPVLVCR